MSPRVLQPEIMDQPGLDAESHHRALRGLDRLNRVSRAADGVISAISRWLPADGRMLRVLDLATGGGALPIALTRWAQHQNIAMEADGCDISQVAISHATDDAKNTGFPNLRYFKLDVVHDPLPQGYDVMICSLFLHHLSDDACVAVLRKAAQAARLVVVNELSRSPSSLAMVWLGSRMLSRSHVVHVDALRSVRAAFTPDELRELAQRAGLKQVSMRHCFPARLLMTGQSQ